MKCPECQSSNVYRDGFEAREPAADFHDTVALYICGECGVLLEESGVRYRYMNEYDDYSFPGSEHGALVKRLASPR